MNRYALPLLMLCLTLVAPNATVAKENPDRTNLPGQHLQQKAGNTEEPPFKQEWEEIEEPPVKQEKKETEDPLLKHDKDQAEKPPLRTEMQTNGEPDDKVKIKMGRNHLTIENLPRDGVLDIYNIMGAKVYSRRVKAGTNQYILSLPRGYYILKIDKYTRKIAVK